MMTVVIPRRLRHGSMILSLAVLSAATACSVAQTLPAPDCDLAGTGLIVAQSVPSASQIPCLLPLPDGWTATRVMVNENHSEVVFDSDRAGEGAASMRLEHRCDVRHTVSVATDVPAADRYDFIERLLPAFRGERYYIFPGGCVWWQFEFDNGTSATEAVAIGEALVLVPRDDLRRNVRENFIDEDI
jgi:hypothetical protein